MSWIKKVFRKTIVLNINMLPQEYKTSDKIAMQRVRDYEKDFNVNVILVDPSPRNTLGNSVDKFTLKKI